MGRVDRRASIGNRRSVSESSVRARQRLRELRAEVAALREIADSANPGDVRDALKWMATQFGHHLDELQSYWGGEAGIPSDALMLMERAVSVAFSMEGAKVFGASLAWVIWPAAYQAGEAVSVAREAAWRRERSSPKRSAARMLRDLFHEHPDKSAAELQRMVEAKAGGRMDASAARAVIRSERATLKGKKAESD